MKNKKIILGLGTITALGAMSVGFIACVKEEKVKEIVEDKTKDLSKLKKDDLNDKFKTLEDKIAALEKQLKEAADKTQINALLKQILDEKINQFEENVGSFFGTKLEKTSFKKSMYYKEDENKNTGLNLLTHILNDKYSDFKKKFDIVNEKALKSKITDDKFKVKIVAKGRSATNSPLFVKEIEIKFFDVLVDDDEIINNAKTSIQGLKDKAAVDKAIKEITLPANQDIEKLEVDSVNGTNVTIKVTMKKKDGKEKTIDKNTFVIKGAIARELVAGHFTNFKPSNDTTKKQIKDHLNQHPDFKENNLIDDDLEIELPTTDDKKATKDKDGEITITAKPGSKRVQGEFKLKIPKLEKLNIDQIQNNSEIKKIKYLYNKNDVEKALKKILIPLGVKEFSVDEKGANDVKVTVEPAATHYLEDKSNNHFILKDAIKKTIKSADIENNDKIKEINNLDDLDAVKKTLAKIRIDGVTKLEAKLQDGSTTNITITIIIDETKYKLEGDKTFNILGAIKSKPTNKETKGQNPQS